jgi:hypothetical protein
VDSSGGHITNVCWWGSYLNLLGGTPCTPSSGSSVDNFTIAIYTDSIVGGSHPNFVQSTTVVGNSATKVDTGIDIPFSGYGNAREYKYSVAIPSFSVTQNTCYWIEITNSTSGGCCWLWSRSAFANDVSALHAGGTAGSNTYVGADATSGDYAFCLSGPNPTGSPPDDCAGDASCRRAGAELLRGDRAGSRTLTPASGTRFSIAAPPPL